ncbi:MAG: AraC family transcriptional regulator [Bacillota bacterium]|nr:AraC family transcriptional regulator [Bacillota bacterium]
MRLKESYEQKNRGNAGFPVEFYHINLNHPRYQMPMHWHMDYEIMMIEKGRFNLRLNDRLFTVKGGDIIYVPGGILHAGEPENCIYHCVVFDAEELFRGNSLAKAVVSSIPGEALFIRQEDTKLYNIARNIFEAGKAEKQGYELVVIGLLYQLFGFLSIGGTFKGAVTPHSSASRKIRTIKAALMTIEQSYQGEMSLDMLSSSCEMSPKYFCRVFKELTGRTPVDYLNGYRVEVACELLQSGKESVTEIALSCGFNDLSYFIKTFKKYKGVSPKQYAKNISNLL